MNRYEMDLLMSKLDEILFELKTMNKMFATDIEEETKEPQYSVSPSKDDYVRGE